VYLATAASCGPLQISLGLASVREGGRSVYYSKWSAVQLVYHLPRSQRHPEGLEVRVPRSFDEFMDILVDKFPHEEEGIRGFYGECWTVRCMSAHVRNAIMGSWYARAAVTPAAHTR
jgi:hypothetical protein